MCWPTISFLHLMGTQMKVGQKYMDSLTEPDISVWITRTKELLAKFDPQAQEIGTYGLGGKHIPTDLQQLKIIRIDVCDSNTVLYVWLGGMDHTYLKAKRENDGSYEFTANYNDERSRVIWPKK